MTSAAKRRFRVVARTNPGVVLDPDSGWSMTFEEKGASAFRVSAFTFYEDPGYSAPLPRQLFVVFDLDAVDLEDAVTEALGNAGGLTTMMAFVGNSYVESPELHVAFDITTDEAPHEYVQTYQPGYPELPQPSAALDLELFDAVHDQLVASPDRKRMGLALVHYNEALRALRPAGEVMAAEHLFMAVEALVDIAKKRQMEARGCADELELAQQLGLPLEEPYKVRSALTGHLRSQVIFHGDTLTHQDLKKASDGFEHGFLAITEVRRHAERGRLPAAFRHVRTAIAELLNLPEEVLDRLTAIEPTYNDRIHANVRGVLEGEFGPTAHPAFKELDFTVSLADVVSGEDGLRLRLEPRVDPEFSDGGSLSEASAVLYRNRLTDEGAAG